MNWRRAGSLAVSLILTQGVVWGQNTSPSPAATAVASPAASAAVSPAASPLPLTFVTHGTEGMTQVIIYFVVIVALLIGGLLLTRSGIRFLPGAAKGNRKLLISETRSLGSRQFLVVAEYEDRKMLLGVCPGRIDYLATLSGAGDDAFSADLKEKEE